MGTISRIKAVVFRLAPKPVKDRLIAYNENRKVAYWQECFKTIVSREEVDELFAKLDLRSDVMVHSSLPDIGDIRLAHITDNLRKYVLDADHTVLCPALPVKGSSYDYLSSIKEFDVRTAPNAMGKISRYYGRQIGARRSLSPTHSVIAIGNQAAYYTEDHHKSETPFTEGSPYFKLILNSGKILMFGATLSHLTFGHVLEDMIGEKDYPVHVYDPHRFEVDLIDEEGTRIKGVFRAHSHKSGRKRDSTEIMDMVRKLPSTKVMRLGCGEIILLDARDVILCLLTQLKSGLSTMGRRHVSEGCRQKADYWIEYLKQL